MTTKIKVRVPFEEIKEKDRYEVIEKATREEAKEFVRQMQKAGIYAKIIKD